MEEEEEGLVDSINQSFRLWLPFLSFQRPPLRLLICQVGRLLGLLSNLPSAYFFPEPPPSVPTAFPPPPTCPSLLLIVLSLSGLSSCTYTYTPSLIIFLSIFFFALFEIIFKISSTSWITGFSCIPICSLLYLCICLLLIPLSSWSSFWGFYTKIQ